MYFWFDDNNQRLNRALSEDVGAPELRNPRHSGMCAAGWLQRILRRAKG